MQSHDGARGTGTPRQVKYCVAIFDLGLQDPGPSCFLATRRPEPRTAKRMSDSTPDLGFKIEVHEEPAWKRVIDVEVPASAVDEAFTRACKSYQGKAKVPGFRPGKVPREIVERRFEPEIKREVLNTLIPQSLSHAYRTHGLIPITDPELSNLHLEAGEPFRYRAQIEIRPTVEVRDYDSLVVHKKTRPVTREHVDETIERIRDQHAEYTPAERASIRGDVVMCDLQETTADRPEAERQDMADVSLELNPERVFPEIADGLVGVRAGETRSITVRYPDGHGNQALAGRTAEFSISVKQVRQRHVPELDSAFFESLSGDITSLDDLQGKVREDLESQTEAEAQREINNEIITQVLSKNPFDLPESLIRDYLARLAEDLKRKEPGITEEEVDKRYKETGIRQVRWEFLYHAIADKESVKVEDADVEAWLEHFAAVQGMDKEDARKALTGSGQVDRIRENLLENKVLSLIRDRSTIMELPTSGSGLIVAPGQSGKS